MISPAPAAMHLGFAAISLAFVVTSLAFAALRPGVRHDFAEV
jgi:hypothetical protein